MEITEKEVEICGFPVKITDGRPFSRPVHTVLILRGRRSLPSSVSMTTGMTSASSVTSLTSVASLEGINSWEEGWRRSVRELQSGGHRAVVVGLPGGCVRNKGEVIRGVLELINREEEENEEHGPEEEEEEEEEGNFIKIEGDEGDHVTTNGVSNGVNGSEKNGGKANGTPTKPVIGVSLGTSSSYILPLLDTPNQLSGWVNISPTSIPPIVSTSASDHSFPSLFHRTNSSSSLYSSVSASNLQEIIPPNPEKEIPSDHPNQIPLLLVYGEDEVKSRTLCEKILRVGVPDNVRVSMVKGSGDLAVDHEHWVKLLKNFLASL